MRLEELEQAESCLEDPDISEAEDVVPDPRRAALRQRLCKQREQPAPPPLFLVSRPFLARFSRLLKTGEKRPRNRGLSGVGLPLDQKHLRLNPDGGEVTV